MATDPTNPGGEEDTGETILDTDTEVDTQVQTESDEPELDDDGNPIEDPDEEVEIDDALKLKVAKADAQKIRDALLRQADYTRKTQELAEQRRTFETERNTVYQSSQEELQAFAHAQNLARQLAAYQNVDWNAWEDQDPFEAQKGWRTFQQMKEAHQGSINTLSILAQQRQVAAQQETAKRIDEGREVLVREIGWNDDLKAKLTNHALERGLSREDLADLEATPVAAQILRDAYEWSQLQKKNKAAKSHETAQQVKAAATVSATRAPPTGLDDRLSQDEWLRRRNKQARKA